MIENKEILQEKQKTEKMKQLNQKLLFYKTIIKSSSDLREANIKMIGLKWNEKRRAAYSEYSKAKDNNSPKNKIEKLYDSYTEIVKQQENEEEDFNNFIDNLWKESNKNLSRIQKEMNYLKI